MGTLLSSQFENQRTINRNFAAFALVCVLFLTYSGKTFLYNYTNGPFIISQKSLLNQTSIHGKELVEIALEVDCSSNIKRTDPAAFQTRHSTETVTGKYCLASVPNSKYIVVVLPTTRVFKSGHHSLVGFLQGFPTEDIKKHNTYLPIVLNANDSYCDIIAICFVVLTVAFILSILYYMFSYFAELTRSPLVQLVKENAKKRNVSLDRVIKELDEEFNRGYAMMEKGGTLRIGKKWIFSLDKLEQSLEALLNIEDQLKLALLIRGGITLSNTSGTVEIIIKNTENIEDVLRVVSQANPSSEIRTRYDKLVKEKIKRQEEEKRRREEYWRAQEQAARDFEEILRRILEEERRQREEMERQEVLASKLRSQQYLRELGIESEKDWKKWLLQNHPDKVPDPQERKQREEVVKQVNACKVNVWG